MIKKFTILNQPIIWLDLDGVIADFNKAFKREFGFKEDPLDWHDHRFIKDYDTISTDEKFWMNIPMLNSPNNIPFNIMGYCTSRKVDVEITKAWLNKHRYPSKQVIQTNDKVSALRNTDCQLFIDDCIYNYINLNNAGILTYLYSRSHNRKYLVSNRIYKLNDIIQYD